MFPGAIFTHESWTVVVTSSLTAAVRSVFSPWGIFLIAPAAPLDHLTFHFFTELASLHCIYRAVQTTNAMCTIFSWQQSGSVQHYKCHVYRIQLTAVWERAALQMPCVQYSADSSLGACSKAHSALTTASCNEKETSEWSTVKNNPIIPMSAF